MTKQEIITRFNLFIDDMSDLSSTEESQLFDKQYRKINASRPWEGTKAEGSTTTSTSLQYVTLASDFLYLTPNANHTDSSYASERPVVFRGSDYRKYEVVSWSDRRQYRESDKHAWIDFPNLRLYFSKVPTTVEAVEYDYNKQMPALELNESPWFPEEYQDALYHMMCADSFVIQQSDKAKSYRNENEKIAKDIVEQMAYWNSQLVQI
jgi:hypothetical protein